MYMIIAPRMGPTDDEIMASVMAADYPHPPDPNKCWMPRVCTHPHYLHSPEFRRRYKIAHKALDEMLAGLTNMNVPTIRNTGILLAQVKLCDYPDFAKGIGGVHTLTTMGVSCSRLFFHPDFVLYLLNGLNPEHSPQQVINRRRTLVSVLIHEALHYAQGDSIYMPFLYKRYKHQPAHLQVASKLANIILDAVHDGAMGAFDQAVVSSGDRNLGTYCDLSQVADHSIDMQNMLRDAGKQLGIPDDPLDNYLVKLSSGHFNKDSAMNEYWNLMDIYYKPESQQGGDAEGDDPAGDGDGDSDTEGSGKPSGGKGTAKGSGGKGSGGLSPELDKHQHVVNDPLDGKEPPSNDELDDLIRENEAVVNSNLHKASVMAGDEPGVFSIRKTVSVTTRKVAWDKILRATVKSAKSAGGRASFHAHRQEEAMRRVYLPLNAEIHCTAGALLDVSGSVVYSGDMLPKFIGQLTQAVMQAGIKSLSVVAFDTETYPTVKITQKNKRTVVRNGLDIKGGGGGTNLNQPLRNYIARMNRGTCDKLSKQSVFIVATDGYVSVPDARLFRQIGAGTIVFLIPEHCLPNSPFAEQVASAAYARATGSKTRVIPMVGYT